VPLPDTWSDRARPGKLQHHSARGKMPRNAGDFTRGSQLITHEFMMWFASAKMPLLVWFFTFLGPSALLGHRYTVESSVWASAAFRSEDGRAKRQKCWGKRSFCYRHSQSQR